MSKFIQKNVTSTENCRLVEGAARAGERNSRDHSRGELRQSRTATSPTGIGHITDASIPFKAREYSNEFAARARQIWVLHSAGEAHCPDAQPFEIAQQGTGLPVQSQHLLHLRFEMWAAWQAFHGVPALWPPLWAPLHQQRPAGELSVPHLLAKSPSSRSPQDLRLKVLSSLSCVELIELHFVLMKQESYASLATIKFSEWKVFSN